jgi:Glycosyl transferase family 2
MKLVLTVSARDEEDVIEANLLYHLNQGVDFVIATDNGSRDGTAEVFERFERDGVLRLLREPSREWNQSDWSTRMARLASSEHGADWVIHTDADEFWWPRQGSLKEVLRAVPPGYGALKAPRLNFVPTRDEANPFWERMTLLEMQSLKWWDEGARRGPVSPKMAHRASTSVVVGHGNHDVRPKRDFERVPGWQPILLFHYPLRSYGQFERKVAMMASTSGRKAPERARLYELYRAGKLREHWEASVPGEDEVAEGLASGRLCVTTVMREEIAAAHGTPVEPDEGGRLRLEACWGIEEGRRARRERRRLKAQITKLTERLERSERRREALAARLDSTAWQRARGQLSRLRSGRR